MGSFIPTQSELDIADTPQVPSHHPSAKHYDALNDLDDKRISEIKPLIPPAILMEDIPLSVHAHQTVSKARAEAAAIISGSSDDRLLVIVGPCSIHDPEAAKAYAAKLAVYASQAAADLSIIMRVYFEKPRTTVGWKGLINDPFLDGTFAVNKGLRIARQLLLDINEMGVPTGCEFLDTVTAQYIGDLVSWGAIGARTTESQVHRELASGLSVPVGFKNGTDGNVRVAIDAIRAARAGHHFLSVTKQGITAIVATTGNSDCHVILRGGKEPNYSKQYVKAAADMLKDAKLPAKVMIDCSHGNSSKDHKRQGVVAQDIANQLADKSADSTGNNIFGVMIESHINEGRQNIPSEGPKALKYGVSITDACIGWEDTIKVLDALREGVRARRSGKSDHYQHIQAVLEDSVMDEM
ncbi:hypothetical protein HK098_007039 [Nowakowskiella sp. JEL0407]|nr:hypothetical protein HK098_007039 [Nowakowskiella sp. JEL0407]